MRFFRPLDYYILHTSLSTPRSEDGDALSALRALCEYEAAGETDEYCRCGVDGVG